MLGMSDYIEGKMHLKQISTAEDIILIGLSRAGKTPLATGPKPVSLWPVQLLRDEPRFFLAQRGFKVANYPVIPGEDPPQHLFDPSLQLLAAAERVLDTLDVPGLRELALRPV